MSLDTADDRTLFFDVLPMFFKTAANFKLKVKLYTVPGQVMHAATRRLVLEGADGIAYIADSQRSEARANNEFWAGLKNNLRALHIDANAIPTVIQFNKRDLPNVRSDTEIDEIARKGTELVYRGIAVRGDGVLETLSGLLGQVWDSINHKHGIEALLKLSKQEFLAKLFAGASAPREGLLQAQ
jgi:signal recognition particle receptor subunit beta